MDKLIKSLSKYPNGTTLIIEWINGCTVLGEIDTIYETDNELEAEDENYQEFYVCLLHVTNILRQSNEMTHFSVGDLIEISMQNPPSKIMLKDQEIVWEHK